MDPVCATLTVLLPDELEALWGYIQVLEKLGHIDAEDACRWKQGVWALSEFYCLDEDVSPAD